MVRLAGGAARYVTREFPADRAQIDIGSYHADDFGVPSGFRLAAADVAGGWYRSTLDWYRHARLADYL